MNAVLDTERSRRDDLAAIHVAKASLGWDDDMYRDIMWSVCTVRSAAQLDFAGRKRFLAHLRACQAQAGVPAARRAAGSAAPKAARRPWNAQQRLLWSLWQQLADAGLVDSRQRRALDAWAKRQTGVDRMEWLNAHQLDLAITSARRWLQRNKGE